MKKEADEEDEEDEGEETILIRHFPPGQGHLCWTGSAAEAVAEEAEVADRTTAAEVVAAAAEATAGSARPRPWTAGPLPVTKTARGRIVS